MQTVTNGTAQHALQDRLNDPATSMALLRLLDRVETLEKAVEAADTMLQQAPAVTAVIGDSVDEFYQQHIAPSGTDLEVVLQHALQIAQSLQNPQLITVITRLLNQTETLEKLVEFVEQGPGLVAALGDMVDEAMRQAQESGLDLDASLPQLLTILTKLQEPQMLKLVNRVLDQPETLDQLVSFLEQGPGLVAMLGDIVDEAYVTANRTGIDIEILLSQGLAALVKFTTVVQSKEFDALMQSGVFDPKAVQVVGNAGNALAESYDEHPRPMGPISLLKLLYDPDIQRALAFAANFGKRFGQQLAK